MMEHNHKREHANDHHLNDNHVHDHHHGGKLAVGLYLIGLVLFFIALFSQFRGQAGLANVLFSVSIIVSGYHIILEGIGDTVKDSLAQQTFLPNIHLLMALATTGAMLIGNFEEGALLIVIFAGAHFLEDYVDGQSRQEITNLLKMNPTEARKLMEDGQFKLVDVADLKPGDHLQVLNGDQIPTDGEIVEGTAFINESSINGESVPKEKGPGDEVYGSTMNGSTSFTMIVTKTSSETVFSQIIEMVNQSQSSLTKTATLIQRLEPKYVTLVLALFPLVLLAGPYVLGWSWETSLYRSMVYLISVSPCALAASAVPATLSTISNLSKQGVLVKGGAFLSKIADLQAIAFDKTGTLTEGRLELTDVDFQADVDQGQLIDVIVAMEKQSNHPLAEAVIRHYPDRPAISLQVTNNIGQGLSATYEGHTYRIGKPTSFDKVPQFFQEPFRKWAQEGKTVVFVAIDEEVKGIMALMDQPQKEAQAAINYFKGQGLHTTMISGDGELTAQAVGRQLGIDEVVANVMPEDKARIVKNLQGQHGLTAMLGDGVNDAPALVTADVGIAMGEGTDIAMDVADLVLMQNDLSKLSYTHQMSQRMTRITWQNIIFSLIVVLTLVTLNFLGKMDIALGVIMHEGSTILVILNALRLLRTPKVLK